MSKRLLSYLILKNMIFKIQNMSVTFFKRQKRSADTHRLSYHIHVTDRLLDAGNKGLGVTNTFSLNQIVY